MAAVYGTMKTGGFLLENSFCRRRIALDYFLPSGPQALWAGGRKVSQIKNPVNLVNPVKKKYKIRNHSILSNFKTKKLSVPSATLREILHAN
ncbi:hypothetical protein D1BOALGB6SA_1191 [Olavius sp. associated proteobacterium Delta 1]|nr:hypothetical protein D1BOALGB6SA_1191 [Olavius sp. associated proteobacterium Delta 1]